jgi:hypothetical protein
MEPQRSLPLSQEVAQCPYPEPEQTSPWLPIPFFEYLFKCHPPIYAWVYQVVPFYTIPLPKPCMYLYCPRYVPHVPPSLLFLLLSPE